MASPSGKPRILRSKLPVRWGYLYWLALLAALSHILLDYTTAYGIRMFAPFNWRWYSWDIVFIVEPVILVALILGLVVPSLFGLINQEIGARSKGPRGRGGAIFALVCLVLIWGFRDYQHRRALNAMGSVLYQGAVPVKHGRVSVLGQSVSLARSGGDRERSSRPCRWTPWLRRSMQQSEAHTYFKPEETPVTQAAKASYFGRVYLDWAVFPLTQTEKLRGRIQGIPGAVSGPALRLSGNARPRELSEDGCCWVLICECRKRARTRGNRQSRRIRRLRSRRPRLS